MANVNTFNLTIWLDSGDITFRGISRVAVKRYIEYYKNDDFYEGNHVEERK